MILTYIEYLFYKKVGNKLKIIFILQSTTIDQNNRYKKSANFH
ncbi:hypothetical protein EV144_10971 [Flavobacterium sp. 270]|nr:hypothetical protein EV144_10971 [Flavobacterium sp. 270]